MERTASKRAGWESRMTGTALIVIALIATFVNAPWAHASTMIMAAIVLTVIGVGLRIEAAVAAGGRAD
jgi:hypothetical protein